MPLLAAPRELEDGTATGSVRQPHGVQIEARPRPWTAAASVARVTDAAWRRRYRAPRSSFPTWARDRADRLTYLSNHIGRFEVFAWDRARDAHRQVTDRPEGTGYRVPARLDPGGEHVWWWNDRKGDEFGTWVVERFEGADRRDAAPLEPSYSTGLALGRAVAAIGRSTGEEGSTVYAVPRGERPLLVYAHRELARVGGLSADEDLVLLSHSEHGDSRDPALRVIDLAGDPVAELWDGPGKGLQPGRWSPLPRDRRVIVHHERTGSRRPMVWDVASGATTEVDVDLPGELFGDWYPDGEALLIGQDHRGRSHLHRYRLATRALEPVAHEPGSLDEARVRPDGEVWYQLNGSVRPPHTLWGSRVVLRAQGPEPPESTPYTDADVKGIHVFVAEPRGGSRPRPALFLVHGGPEAHDRDRWDPEVQTWVDHGFLVLMVNYRGSSGYGKEWRDAIRGKPGLTELEDIATVQDWAVAQGLADRDRCVIGGASWGGYLTLLGLGTQPERWAAGLAGVPIGDYIAAFEDEMEPLKRYDAALFGGTPDEVPQSYRERNPITYAERVRAPVMMLVGRNDPRCPSRSADVYEARLRELGKAFETYRYDAGHGSLVIDERIRQMEAQIAFLAKHLGTPKPL
ncbi:MAG: S9 family peptidase [Chloroflexi bacterium]|nr:S9 family peptidase [Chloroflexota bacterium]